ncbi:MAG: hypothetical protein NT091_02080 [Candidatus Falkowbacteria bacterium]|nr:hypothetical protein [Candidatus Falkowbacteria bacterium]
MSGWSKESRPQVYTIVVIDAIDRKAKVFLVAVALIDVAQVDHAPYDVVLSQITVKLSTMMVMNIDELSAFCSRVSSLTSRELEEVQREMDQMFEDGFEIEIVEIPSNEDEDSSVSLRNSFEKVLFMYRNMPSKMVLEEFIPHSVMKGDGDGLVYQFYWVHDKEQRLLFKIQNGVPFFHFVKKRWTKPSLPRHSNVSFQEVLSEGEGYWISLKIKLAEIFGL